MSETEPSTGRVGGPTCRPTGRAGEPATAAAPYAERLRRLESARWKRLLDVQAPYRRNVRRLAPGRTLDVGCGLGRNLAHLGGNGVGVDHNATAVAECRRRGLVAYTSEEFASAPEAVPGGFDHLVLAHVLEHLAPAEAQRLVHTYLPYLRAGGTVVVITPQEAGQRSDATHLTFVDFAAVRGLCDVLGLRVVTQRSFPLPRPVGRVFKHNEFVTVARAG